jgi:nucleoside-diphosphate-sugar epimerase
VEAIRDRHQWDEHHPTSDASDAWDGARRDEEVDVAHQLPALPGADAGKSAAPARDVREPDARSPQVQLALPAPDAAAELYRQAVAPFAEQSCAAREAAALLTRAVQTGVAPVLEVAVQRRQRRLVVLAESGASGAELPRRAEARESDAA